MKDKEPLVFNNIHIEGHFYYGAVLPPDCVFTIIPTDSPNKMCDCNQGRMACNGKCEKIKLEIKS